MKRDTHLRVLLVSLAFPPKENAEVLQTAKLHKYLVAQPDTEIHVVTSLETRSLRAAVRPRVHSREGLTEFELFSNRYLNYATLRLAPARASRPDLWAGAIKRVDAVCAALPWRPDVILSRSYPISSAILAQGIATRLELPWFLHLSDPWTLSPLHPKAYDLEWNKKRERAALSQAARISFTSTRTLEKYARVYPEFAGRMRYLPNTYDPAARRPNPWGRGPRFRVVYTGTLGQSRHPDGFCKALETFLERVPEARGTLDFVMAGHADRATRAFLAAQPDYVNWRGPVPFSDAMELIRSADLLALIDNKLPKEAGKERYEFFPSKLLDYMLGQRPILGLSEPESLASQLVADLGLGVCHPHDRINALSLAIEAKWRAWKDNLRSEFDVSVQDSRYDAHALAKSLRQELKEISDAAFPTAS